jgi:methyl-accepting chemotaxis protein
MLKDLKIGARLGLGFGLILFMFIVAGGAALLGFNSVTGTMQKMLSVDARVAQYSAEARTDVLQLRRAEKDFFLNTDDPAKQEGYYDTWLKNREELTSDLDGIKKAAELKEDQDALDTMKRELAAYESGFVKVHGMMMDHSIKTSQEANHAINQYKDSIHALEKASDGLATAATTRMNAKASAANGSAKKTSLVIAMLMVIAVALGAAISFFTTRRITRPLTEGVDMSGEIANGDLTGRDLAVHSNDELGVLASSLNRMKGALSGIIGSIAGTSSQVASSSEELSVTVQQITKRVNEQAEKASQVATSSAEMSQTVVDIAKNASQMADSAKNTVSMAQEGSDVVGKTISEVKEIASMVTESSNMMASLGDRSRQIGEIVTVINDIADQTNLLALNAAIEAARAGEQGRGFAVVADEVKKLAERTARATKEIGDMIKAIQDETKKSIVSMKQSLHKVNIGTELSAQAGDSLHRIVESANGLQAMIVQIASATEQMSSVSEQISQYIEEIAAISKETSTSSTEIARATMGLSRLSVELNGMASRFKISTEARDAASTRRAEPMRKFDLAAIGG